MMNTFVKWTLVCAVTVLSACNNQPQTGNVAILDIGAVSEKTGSTQTMSDRLKTMQTGYQEKLNKLQNELQEKIAIRQKEFGKTPPTDEQRQEISKMMSNAQKEFSDAQNKASQGMQREQANLVLEFREKIRPAAKKVAESRGLSLILLKNDALVLDADPSVDITDAVVEILKKEEPAPTTEMTEQKAPEPMPEVMKEATDNKEMPDSTEPATTAPAPATIPATTAPTSEEPAK